MKWMALFSAHATYRNRKAALRLMVGVLLCAFLVTVVGIVANSFIQSKWYHDKEVYGEQSVITSPVDEGQEKELEEGSFWRRKGVVGTIGGIHSEQGGNAVVMGHMDETARSLAHIRLKDGRMPEKKGEIAVEEDAAKRMGLGSEIVVGSQITLAVSPAGEMYHPEEDVREQPTDRTFTVVGLVCAYSGAWFETLNYAGNGRDEFGPYYFPLSIFVSEEEMFDVPDRITNYLLWREKGWAAKLEGNIPKDVRIVPNQNVYREENGVEDLTWNRAKLIAGVVIGVILATMVFFICSMFLVSVDVKRQQFALLRTIGATKRQIVCYVLAEGFVVATVASVTGALLGVAASIGVVRVFGMLVAQNVNYPILTFVHAWIPMVAVALCVVTTLVAAAFPAVKAGRTSLVEAASYGGKKRRRRRNASSIGTDELGASFFVRHGLRGSKVRVAFYVVSMAFCIATVNALAFGVNTLLEQLEARRGSDFYMSTMGYGWEGDLPSEDTVEADGDLLPVEQKIRGLEGVSTIHTSAFVIAQASMDEEKMSEYVEQSNFNNYDIAGQTGFSFLPHVTVYDDAGLASLKGRVMEGDVDVEAMKAGKEVALCLPPFWKTPEGYNEYDYYKGTIPTVGTEHYRDDRIRVGDAITFLTNPGNPAISEEKTVTIGAIVDTQSAMNIIVAEGGLEAMGMPYLKHGMNVYMEDGADLDESEAQLLQMSREYNLNFNSLKDETRRIYRDILLLRYAGGLLGGMLAFIGVAIYLYATVIRLRHRRREMGLLRIVGMTIRQCMGLLCREGLIYGLLSAIVGFALALAVAMYLEPFRWRYFVSPLVLAVSLGVGIAMSVGVPYLYGKRMLAEEDVMREV